MTVNRRTFLIATSAAALPAGCSQPATATSKLQTQPETLDQIIDRLVEALRRSNPKVSAISHHLETCRDGSVRLYLRGDVPMVEYDGPGFYEISHDGYPMIYWVDRDEDYRPRSTGDAPPFYCALYSHGEFVEARQYWKPKFISKLGGHLA